MALTADAQKFASALSAATRIPVSVVNAWIACESGGGNQLAAPYNFLNYGNPSVVFPSVDVAASTCAQEINTGTYYVGLRAAIATNDISNITEAIVECPWAEGHYGAPLTSGNNKISGYPNRDAAQSCVGKNVLNYVQGQVNNAAGGNAVINGVSSAITDPIQTLIDLFNGIGHFFSILTTRATWVRIGEILGGAILIGVAINLANRDIYKTPIIGAIAGAVNG